MSQKWQRDGNVTLKLHKNYQFLSWVISEAHASIVTYRIVTHILCQPHDDFRIERIFIYVYTRMLIRVFHIYLKR